VRSLIGSLASDGTTVLVSSHLLAEVEQICSHLGVMREGRLVAQGTVAQVRGAGPTLVRVRTRQPEAAAAVLRGLGVEQVGVEHGAGPAGAGGEVHGIPGQVEPERIVATLVRAGVGVQGFTVAATSLEDLFVALTGEGFDVSG
jgi:ABC-2 type transport system ATP-binding protein